MSTEFLFWLIAVVVFIYGLVIAIRGQILLGIVLCVLALLIGPGGVTVFY